MNKQARKLINGVAEFMKTIKETGTSYGLIKVHYDFSRGVAMIFVPPTVVNTGNGYERHYCFKLIDQISEVSTLKGITYSIGINDSFEMNIKIIV